ncbi:molybdenum cofactor sulfurase protein-like protein [Cenococcum geophilum 1.58]|uniref:molybdenum cofactor sulfurase protein-like protein n=1 Tax=Cenococcum geophilum 1.58 TaxID=794803 RepID=UPI00358EE1AF|nr:molybdenum cofactor sulfurase protein-like protein [Cenococcum geophilum 1.58]
MGEQGHIRYNKNVENIRLREYPMLQGTTYLDHAGTTLYAKSLVERFSADMISNLYGNPHSASMSSQLSTRRIEDIRLRLLGLFNADPETFDVIFVANATAGIKLVMEAFRDQENGFWYGYHRDSHTSLVGVREVAKQHRCFTSDAEVECWLDNDKEHTGSLQIPALFAYPAQSNMNGRRLPLDWCQRSRLTENKSRQPVYTLLDAASFVTTSPLDLSDGNVAPDFIVLSLYKIFGFPDLGALIVRKASGHVFDRRRYFGGGTVDMVVCLKERWHAKKSETLHEQLEDGTLPIHSIMALNSAMDVHQELFGSLEQISGHTAFLAKELYNGLSSLRHGNGTAVCEVYKEPSSIYGNPKTQGPIVSFNIRSSHGGWVSNAEVEKLSAVKNFQVRTGGLCNPGGIASFLGLAPWEMRQNFSAGQRCGNDNDIMGSKPTGMIRASLGAMSTTEDVNSFVEFVRGFYAQKDFSLSTPAPVSSLQMKPPTASPLHVESLTIYPIKSCAGWQVPLDKPWEVRREGLAWDREWCLVHQGTGAALSQKRYPKMALVRPSIDLDEGVLRIRFGNSLHTTTPTPELTVPLSADPTLFSDGSVFKQKTAKVCGDSISAKTYKSNEISRIFTEALGVACHLARFPAVGSGNHMTASSRHSKAHLQPHQIPARLQIPGEFPDTQPVPLLSAAMRPILLSNESPILTISRSSLNRLNELIKEEGGKAAQAEVFRANIVVAENLDSTPGNEQPYAEDHWRYIQIGHQYFEMLGSCRRCQMVCIDQHTAEKNEEPYVTLAKTRRFDGKVFFGQHTCHIPFRDVSSPLAQNPTISVGDLVKPYEEGDAANDLLLESLVNT